MKLSLKTCLLCLGFAWGGVGVAQGDPLVVRTMPSYTQNTAYANNILGEGINVWGRVTGGTAPYQYSWNFGDGSSQSGSVSDPSYIGLNHTYSASGSKTATLTVTDAANTSVSRTTTIRVFLSGEVDISIRENIAIEKGLLYLYQNSTADNGTGGLKWEHEDSAKRTSYRTVGSTGFAVLAFQENGHLGTNDDALDIYAETVQKGLNFILKNSQAGTMNIPSHSDGIATRDSDTAGGKAPGKGAYVLRSGSHDMYANNVGLLAILLACPDETAAKATIISGGPFNGWSYYELIVEAIDLLKWCQGDGGYRGSWGYTLTQQQIRWDGSTQQWPIMVMKAAKERWGITVPQWVKDNSLNALAALRHSSKGIGYSNSSNSGGYDTGKTGGGLLGYKWSGLGDQSAEVLGALGYIQNTWLNSSTRGIESGGVGWSGNLYGMFALKKGLDAAGVDTLTVNGVPREWQKDLSAWLLGLSSELPSNFATSHRSDGHGFGQRSDGSWWEPWLIPSHGGRNLGAAFGVGILSRGVTTFNPIPKIAQLYDMAPGQGFEVDGSGSTHANFTKNITEWKWVWNAPGDLNQINWDSPAATGPKPTNPGYANLGSYVVALRVGDDSSPTMYEVTSLTVNVTSGQHMPVAVTIPPSYGGAYGGRLGQSIATDATSSFDFDAGDTIVGYQWDLGGAGVFAAGGSTATVAAASYVSQGRVGLKVQDSAGNWSIAKYADYYFSDKDIVATNLSVDSFSLSDANVTVRVTLAAPADSNGILEDLEVRFYDGDPMTSGNAIGDLQTLDLSPGQSAELSLSFATETRPAVVYVRADPAGKVFEWSEANNILSVSVTPNSPPSDLAINPSAIAENQANGTVVGVFSPTDPDDPNGTGTYLYSLVSGNGSTDNASFRLDANGTLKTASVFDYETKTTYVIRVRLADEHNASYEEAFTISVTDLDDTAPVITLGGSATVIHEAATVYSDAGAIWTDAVDGNGSTDVSGTVDVSVPGDHVLTYSKTDAAGNAATQVTRTVTVTDSTKPVITLTGDAIVTHEAATSYSDAGATWADTLDGNGTLDANGTVNANVPGTYVLTYSKVDATGNVATQVTRTVIVQDTAKPVISLVGLPSLIREASHPYNDAGATWTDTLDSNGTLEANGTVNTNVPGTYILSYSKTDVAGNIADQVVRTVKIVDTTPLVISLNGSSSVTHEAAKIYNDAGATWSDAVDGNGTVEATGTLDVNAPWTYYLSFDATDVAGNVASTVIRTVTVQDTTKPVITLTGDAAVTHEAATLYLDTGATWTDTLDGNGTIVAVGTVNVNLAGVYVLTYDITDVAGNAADRITRTVTVVDTTKPVISLTGDATVTHEAATLYSDAGATWTDTLDGNGTLVAVGSVNENAPGAYVLTYDFTDVAGNAADQVTRTVTVQDTTKPVITLTGDAAVTHEATTDYSDAGATWTDTLDGNGTLVAVGSVNINVPGVYTLTYDVTDAAGNVADQVTRTVTVVDTTKPVITLTGDATVTHEAATSYSDDGSTWTDTLDGNGTLDTNGSVNPLLPGVYSLAFGVADAAGNAADEVTRTVTVVDTTNPVITLEGNATIRHRVWRPYLDQGAGASDTLDGNLTNKISTTNPVNASVPGSYEVSYSVSDAAGNAATVVTRSVVVFNEAPSGLLLSNASVEENLPSGALIGTFSTEDPDDSDGSKSYAYAKVFGNGLTVSSDGALRTSEPFDFESSSSHEIVVRTTDEFGAFLEKTFTISVIDAFVPGVDTAPATEVMGTSSVLNGSIADAGDSQGVTERGFVFGRSPNPETSGGSTLASGSGSGSFTASATDLTPGRVYYYKAYARNAEGVSYGSQERFTTPQDRSSALWSDATVSGANWRSSDWFGSFYLTDTPWLYHGELGWLYASGTSSSSVWLWTESLGWVWTGKETFPYLYRDADADTGWYHWNGTVNGRSLFYRYSDSQWIDFPLGGNAEAYK